MTHSTTIYALSSAAGRAGVSVIRISGPEAKSFLQQCTEKKDFLPRQATLTAIIDPQSRETLDQAIIIFFPAPHSFTGEDVVELHVHGSLAVIQDVLQTLSNLQNYHLAAAGEFSKRAFHNNKMDLTEIEGLADLIESETSLQRRQALQQMSGQLRQLYEEWRHKIIRILALTEAQIDFIDEELPDDLLGLIFKDIADIQQQIQNHLNDDHKGERLRSGFHIALIGPPNAGKSSLLNILAKRDIAIVSPYEGTTRDLLEAHLDIAGYPVIFVDTAGIRETSNPIEKEGIKRSIERAEQADIVMRLVEATHIKTPHDIPSPKKKNEWIIINKTDVKPLSITTIPPHTWCISAATGAGIQNLICGIKDELNLNYNPSHGYITRTRYRTSLENCLQNLSEIYSEQDIELIAENLRLACRALDQIMGKVRVDDLLDVIFKEFCIGK